jgi:hypothetical protein
MKDIKRQRKNGRREDYNGAHNDKIAFVISIVADIFLFSTSCLHLLSGYLAVGPDIPDQRTLIYSWRNALQCCTAHKYVNLCDLAVMNVLGTGNRQIADLGPDG